MRGPVPTWWESGSRGRGEREPRPGSLEAQVRERGGRGAREPGSRGAGALLWHKLGQSWQNPRGFAQMPSREASDERLVDCTSTTSYRRSRDAAAPPFTLEPAITESSRLLPLSHHHPTRPPTAAAWAGPCQRLPCLGAATDTHLGSVSHIPFIAGTPPTPSSPMIGEWKFSARSVTT